MKIVLYKTTSSVYELKKSLTNPKELLGTLRNETSVINPQMFIEHDNITMYNYLYIPDFKRYYFINNIQSIRNNLWRIDTHVDVLHTYANEILNHKCIINKQESHSKAEMFLDDGDFVLKNSKHFETITFDNGLNDNGEIILITAGG